jgi:predicted O-methyltransferase YrrM
MNTRILIGTEGKPFWNIPEMFSDIPWHASCASKTTGIMLASLILSFGAKTILEIGIANGFTTACLLKALGVSAPREGLLVSCDINENCCLIAERMKKDVYHIVVRGNSSTAKWEKTFGKRKCDIIFIDGDHSYEACKEDILRSTVVLREGGLVVLHDYALGQSGVWKAVEDTMKPPEWGRLVIPENAFACDIASVVCQKLPKWMRV